MASQPHPRLTPEEYLEIERKAEWKSEFYNGRMFAMAGGSARHSLITGNAMTALNLALEDQPSTVGANDLRVNMSQEGLYTYPDATVVCGDIKLADSKMDTLLNPTVIVEVLSPSTEACDRGFKFEQYMKIEALQEYVLVAQSKPRVEIFRRQPDGDWMLRTVEGLEGSCRLESVNCSIPMSRIYAKVNFGEEPEGTPPGP